MRSAPGVWYTGGYYEKIYLLDLRKLVSKAMFNITYNYEQIMNKR
jgi:hypothetical protein